MIKIRLQGRKEEISRFMKELKSYVRVRNESDALKNKGQIDLFVFMLK